MHARMTSPLATRASTAAVLGWAAYLAASWTWCIGMFLPVLLFRDFGPLSFLIFAIPNCLGAAALPYWFKSPDLARRFLAAHLPAIRAFSAITLAFQWFFMAWVVLTLGLGVITIAPVLGAALVMCILPQSRASAKRWHLGAALVLVASLILIAAWIARDPAQVRWTNLPPPLRPSGEIVPLASVCIFGFTLCPLLDRTFHEANLALSRGASRLAFVLAFLLFFPLMILLTLLYAPSIVRGSLDAGVSITLVPASYFVLAHIVIQLAFTIAAHTRVWNDPSPSNRPSPRPRSLAIDSAPIAGVVLGIAAFLSPSVFALAAPEITYRAFMVAYGLLAPAYVWLCVVPGPSRTRSPARSTIGIVSLAIALALPFYWMGFMFLHTWCLLPGIVTILLARAFTNPRSKQEPPALSGAPAPIPSGPGSLAARAQSPHDGHPAQDR
jgi:hypothetical protein